MDDSKTLRSIESKLSALLALTVLSLPTETKGVKLEIILKNAGLEIAEIVKVLAKNEGAVRKVIQRAK